MVVANKATFAEVGASSPSSPMSITANKSAAASSFLVVSFTFSARTNCDSTYALTSSSLVSNSSSDDFNAVTDASNMAPSITGPRSSRNCLFQVSLSKMLSIFKSPEFNKRLALAPETFSVTTRSWRWKYRSSARPKIASHRSTSWAALVSHSSAKSKCLTSIPSELSLGIGNSPGCNSGCATPFGSGIGGAPPSGGAPSGPASGSGGGAPGSMPAPGAPPGKVSSFGIGSSVFPIGAKLGLANIESAR